MTHEAIPAAPRLEPELVRLPEQPTIAVRYHLESQEGIEQRFDEGFQAIGAALSRAQLQPAGPAFAHYDRMPTEPFTVELGFPTDAEYAGLEFPGDTKVITSKLSGGHVATLSHLGGFDGLGTAWERLLQWAAAHGHRPVGHFWEVYVTEPTPDMDPSTLRTDLFLPVSS
ncbi:transcriptional regulator [Pseudoclavibacter endophyticus]|uniref:GyrI-like domain-containing protein n=1 Tax=Pseudoclavibacter endophyticus TaxID=1778590 RepID=UPI001669BDE0|nr:GyrI-like domain-containing protein [Pseudoclavibacter endophyticus]GGA73389.1 transcriptional regulator [Pseudoclavibacter endophyticus]